jgi:hypothetical protein
MIPAFNHSHVLPPFLGATVSYGEASPYITSAAELVQRFGFTPERRTILESFLALRAKMRRLGFAEGFQWVDGSFVENIEAHADRPPSDLDVVSFVHSPPGLSATQVQALMDANPDLFVKERCRDEYRCDLMVINLGKKPEKLVQDVRYWYGLFSHRRGDHVWKGLLQIPMVSDDERALSLLDNPATGDIDASTA